MIKVNSVRRIITATLAFLSAIPLQAQEKVLSEELRQAIKDVKAQIGIAVIVDGKDTVTINDTVQYPMLSVFKFHQALAVMDYLHRHNLSPDAKIYITGSDLKPDTYSPLRNKYPYGNIDLSIAELLKYSLQQSDNNACDILFRYIGGTKTVDSYIRSLGIQDFSVTATEDDMHRNPEVTYDNWTTPLAAAKLVEIFLQRNLFPETYQRHIFQTMTTCQTGKNRLPEPLSDKDIIIGHKTGSSGRNSKGQRTGTNDIGFVILPDGYHYSIAVFVKDSDEEDKTNEQIIATISRIVYEYVQNIHNKADYGISDSKD